MKISTHRFRWLLCLVCLSFLWVALLPLGQQAHAAVTGGMLGNRILYSTADGDTWFNTWADDGNIYATSNDTAGFNDNCNSDIAINEITGNDPGALTAPFVNCMTSMGTRGDYTQYPDGCSWKSGGIISVASVLYLAVARQICPNDITDYPRGFQASRNASILKSTDHGRTWTNSFGTSNDSK